MTHLSDPQNGPGPPEEDAVGQTSTQRLLAASAPPPASPTSHGARDGTPGRSDASFASFYSAATGPEGRGPATGDAPASPTRWPGMYELSYLSEKEELDADDAGVLVPYAVAELSSRLGAIDTLGNADAHELLEMVGALDRTHSERTVFLQHRLARSQRQCQMLHESLRLAHERLRVVDAYVEEFMHSVGHGRDGAGALRILAARLAELLGGVHDGPHGERGGTVLQAALRVGDAAGASAAGRETTAEEKAAEERAEEERAQLAEDKAHVAEQLRLINTQRRDLEIRLAGAVRSDIVPVEDVERRIAHAVEQAKEVWRRDADVRAYVEREAGLEVVGGDEAEAVRGEEAKAVGAELAAETRAELESKIRRDLESDMRAEAESDMRAELESDIRRDLESDMRAELESNIRRDLESDMRAELESNIRRELESDIRRDLESDIRRDLESDAHRNRKEDLRPEFESDLRHELEADVLYDLRHQLQPVVLHELRHELKADVLHDLHHQLKPSVLQDLGRQLKPDVLHNLYLEWEQHARPALHNQTPPSPPTAHLADRIRVLEHEVASRGLANIKLEKERDQVRREALDLSMALSAKQQELSLIKRGTQNGAAYLQLLSQRTARAPRRTPFQPLPVNMDRGAQMVHPPAKARGHGARNDKDAGNVGPRRLEDALELTVDNPDAQQRATARKPPRADFRAASKARLYDRTSTPRTRPAHTPAPARRPRDTSAESALWLPRAPSGELSELSTSTIHSAEVTGLRASIGLVE
ncbi:hypothetical protein MSPP1_000574 [Malassezia sp. CBS 17886]|nr:hypothetical protein MSPP1_000574 [Malassezia sp. CBS 17886]